ncbi:glycosyltransferase [Herbiconiux ginsengi]|uniref:Undecaprenyl-phosphate 4-deoxy-4-formamido-L-arabinose transferase n=1 Tax=Herbiconiux ginsengi TaxID=381665 RepID=A0A1H3SSP7_9MICO|nr:glycosyltransferase [Herbiconiux ginsengi]SDZ41123.1 undecaprenyl-phosphate 4-deoxy-4-formamido-L-arabinose transferase [Herbiconiux ginsengi]
MDSADPEATTEYTISVVVPVYQGERTLAAVVAELEPYTRGARTPDGVSYRITEVILVHDNGPDHSDTVMRSLEIQYPFVRILWLSRNFGQHAATIAGMATSKGRWILTMDEDGQHDPASIGAFLDTAIRERAGVVYARFTNERPHGLFRAAASKSSKRMMRTAFNLPDASQFQSYRLVRGDMGRKVAEFAATGVYLDVALSWVTNRVATSPTVLRTADGRVSGYSVPALFAYFWRMVLTSGTTGLRAVSVLGGIIALIGLAIAVYVVVSLSIGTSAGTEGWASLIVVVLLCSGAILVALGVIAEYIGVSLNVSMGRPLYLVVDNPETIMPEEESADPEHVLTSEIPTLPASRPEPTVAPHGTEPTPGAR